jgi:hypothetical protein
MSSPARRDFRAVFEQLSIAHLVWPTVITSLFGLLALVIRAYARHQLVKTSLKRVKQDRRAEVIKALAALLDERHWWQRRRQPPQV